MSSGARIGALLGLAVLLPGCPNGANMRPEPVAAIDRVELHAIPTAVNWDERPGPDGLEVRVFCYRIDRGTGSAEAVPVSGTLEVLLFEGMVSAGEVASKPAAQTWTLEPQWLAESAKRSMVGWCYQMRLPWQGAAPKSGSVTVIARYRPPGPEKQWIYSAPNASIVVRSK